MKIYSYYAEVPDLNRFDELKLITVWREAWTAAGWEPFVLSEWYARKHPLYAALDELVSKLPSTNPARYERACYMRWLALAAIGGGWMSDYDCFPAPGLLGTPTIDTGNLAKWPNLANVTDFKFWHTLTGVDMNKIQVLQTPCCPAVVYCAAENAEKFAHAVIAGSWNGLGNRPQGDKAHYSDQYALEDLVIRKEDWIQPRSIVKLWGDAEWEKAPIVHFANAVMGPGGKLPRWKHIPQLLK